MEKLVNCFSLQLTVIATANTLSFLLFVSELPYTLLLEKAMNTPCYALLSKELILISKIMMGYVHTVKPLIMDPPKSGLPLYSGHITYPN